MTEEAPVFNGAIQTLFRIDGLLKDCSSYAVNENVLGWRNNLIEVYKETQGFLTKEELKTAKNKWEDVNKHPIIIKGFSISYDTELIEALHDFDHWVRMKLHRHNVTSAKNRQAQDGMARVMAKYNLQNGTPKK